MKSWDPEIGIWQMWYTEMRTVPVIVGSLGTTKTRLEHLKT